MKRLKLFLLTAFLLTANISFAQNKVLDSLFTQLKKANTDIAKAELLNAISSEYIENDPTKMAEYAQKALELSKKQGYEKHEADAWFNLGNANIMMSNYAKAIKSFTSAQDIYEKLKDENINTKEVTGCLAKTYGSIGIVCSEQANYAKALEYYFKALKIYREEKEEN